MNLFRTAIELFGLYILYKLIFDFILPLAKTTRQVKKQFTEMSAQMKEKMHQQPSQSTNDAYHNNITSAPKGNKDDYIEFEEVK